jgi:hypothetical protein
MTDLLVPPRPVLHLSGAKLRAALERVIAASEPIGGVERFIAAVKLRGEVIRDRLQAEAWEALQHSDFEEIVPLMPTVRRRIGPLLTAAAWPATRSAIGALFYDAHVCATTDQRIAAFEHALSPSYMRMAPENRASTRFLRDLAAELLHGVYPEHYPLMTRWVWDAKSNSGALREIWHDPHAGDATDGIVIDVPDTHETFLVLREELAQFLSEQGMFRDMLWTVDLVLGQVYGDYINAQGGAWLKTDFGSQSDPLEHTRRILGLDRIAGKAGRVRNAVDATVSAPLPLAPGARQ